MEQKLNSNSSAGTAADSNMQPIVIPSADIAVNPVLGAVCPDCNGDGYFTGVDYQQECCGMPTPYGSCCGNGVMVEIGVQIPCERCACTGRVS